MKTIYTQPPTYNHDTEYLEDYWGQADDSGEVQVQCWKVIKKDEPRLINASELRRKVQSKFKAYLDGGCKDNDCCALYLKILQLIDAEDTSDEDKYCWHDLRKNPDDLPEKNKDVVVYNVSGDYETDVMVDGIIADKVWLKEVMPIIKWKYIDPCEKQLEEGGEV